MPISAYTNFQINMYIIMFNHAYQYTMHYLPTAITNIRTHACPHAHTRNSNNARDLTRLHAHINAVCRLFLINQIHSLATHHFAGIHCPNLTLPHHALVVSDPRSTIAGSVVTYGCQEGYELDNGSLVLECHLDGHWSDDPPQCTGRLTYINQVARIP